MRRLSIAILPLCLLLGACAPDDRGAGTPTSAAAPVASAPLAADAPAPVPADEHAHHHDIGAGATLKRPPGGGNWATDAPLRQGMERIHAAMADALPAFENGELGVEAANALADVIQGQVQFLVANCKLEPAADAQLHIVIGHMLAAADAMAKEPASSEGMPRLHEAVQLYGEYFEHPGLHGHDDAPQHADGESGHDEHAADPAGG